MKSPGPGGELIGERILIDWMTSLAALKGLGFYALKFSAPSPKNRALQYGMLPKLA